MSSGGVAVPVGALVVLPLAAVAAAGAAAVLTVRACGAATEALGRAAMRLGDALDETAGQQDRAEIQAQLWQIAASDVVGLNASIRLLQARSVQVGASVRLPAPFTLTGGNIADARSWAVRTEQALPACRAAIERAAAKREQSALLSGLTPPATNSVSASDLLLVYQNALLERVSAVPEPIPVDADAVQDRIGRVLRRLDLDASVEEREQALRAAADTASQTSVGAMRSYLTALAVIVDTQINARVARRRLAATWLEALEDAVVVDALAATDPVPPYFDAVERLRAVVRGEDDLTDRDRNDIRDALVWSEKAAHERRILDAVHACLKEQKFAVTIGFTVGHSAGLRASLPSWKNEHSADFWVDEAGHVRGELLRDVDQAANESARCAELNEKLEIVAADLRARGLTSAAAVTKKTAAQRRVGKSTRTNTTNAATPHVRARTLDDN